MNLEKILLVDDALAMQKIVKATLGDKYDLTCVGSITEAQQALTGSNFSLIVLDVVLPDGDGFEFCKYLREHAVYADIPLIFLTGQSEVDQRVLGLSLGGDDYIVKPLEPREFMARIEAKLKRRKQGPSTQFLKKNFKLDLSTHKAFMTEGKTEQEMNLTPTEFRLLHHFLKKEGVIFSREELLTAAWGSAVHVSGHTVDTHISSLRKKMGSFGACIKAAVKQGYYFSFSPDLVPIPSAELVAAKALSQKN